ncbi:MAG TPA: 4-hydroxy-tetrahydrodipicolinate reductase [Sphingobacteriaceae bacterium]|nr:4-hydroxy-tetrahydrodipicolinate reductase [Sphingobacteriaceae bacterium]
MSNIRVVVAGATGKTGSAITRALIAADGIEVVGAVARGRVSSDLGEVLGLGPVGVAISDDLAGTLEETKADVLVDFTNPQAAPGHTLTALELGVRAVVGTTGMGPSDLEAIRAAAESRDLAAMIIPNFCLGALLLFRMAKEAARIFHQAEIIEMHHATKVDAPSGTALRLGEAIASQWDGRPVPTHSVRLPGLVAHHAVIFGGDGETVTLRHDTVSRDAFGPGVVLAVRRVHQFRGLITDLEAVFADQEPAV